MHVLRWAQLCCIVLSLSPWQTKAVVAQTVLPDSSVGTQVQQTKSDQSFAITGGALRGTNLFHSFETFSPGARDVRFDLQLDGFNQVERIFSRVTGKEVSHIDGLLQTLGGNRPDLFLLNPNGVVFGANARLDLGGSFVGTTAEAIHFEDGTSFATAASPSATLLSLSVPVGLQLGQRTGAIALTGPGHEINNISPSILPQPFQAAPTDYEKGLKISPGHTIALIGNGLTIEGGTLQSQLSQASTPLGGVQFSLGSGQDGQVALQPHSQWGWTFDYGGLTRFSKIQLSRRTRIDGTGLRPSTIQVDGHDVVLADGSTVYSQNLGDATNGNIRFSAQGQLLLEGTPDAWSVPSGISNSVNAQGDGGAIEISAGRLTLTGGSSVSTTAFRGSGNAGQIQIQVEGDFSLKGDLDAQNFSPFATLVTSTTNTTGNSGGVGIETGSLLIENGALISSSALFGTGNSSNIQVSATESILVQGVNPLNQFVSGIASSAFSSGDAGSIHIETPRLSLLDSGLIEASAYASGNAGDITVNASEYVEIGRVSPVNQSGFAAYMASNTKLSDGLIIRRFFSLPQTPSGNAGSVTIQTPALRLFGGGSISTTNEGSGNGGSLEMEVGQLSLDGSSLTASTAAGNGGNIALRGIETLTLRNGSMISASAGGKGNGGNIKIAAQTIIAKPSENSDIAANAVGSAGGSIMLDTSAILGLAVRQRPSKLSDVTASSELGSQFSGRVELARPNAMPDSGLAVLPETTLEPVERLAQGCDTGEAQFHVTGRGGLARSPSDLLELDLAVAAPRNQPALLTKAVEKPVAEPALPVAEQPGQRAGTQQRPKTEHWLAQAVALRDQGFYPQALDRLRALSDAEALATTPEQRVQVLRQMGITYRLLGQLDAAQTMLEQSLALAQEQSLPQAGAATVLSLGHLAQAKGNLPRAKQLYQHVLSETADPALPILALASLAGLDLNRGERGMAQQWRSQLTQQLSPKSGPQSGSKSGLQSSPQSGLQSNSPSAIAARLHVVAVQLEALQRTHHIASPETLSALRGELQQVLTWAEQQGDPQVLAYGLGYLGQVEEQSGNWELALQYSEAALQQAQAQSSALMQYRWAWQLGRIARHRWQQAGEAHWYRESQRAYRLALDALQSLRSDLVTVAPALQISFRSAIEPVYREYVDLLLAHAEDGPGELLDVATRNSHLREAIDTVEALRLAELDNYLQDACLTSRPQSVAEIDPEAAVIYPIILGDRLEVILSHPDGAMSRHAVSLTRDQLDQTVKAFRDGLVWRSQRDFRGPSQQLYQWLIQPILADLQGGGIETLVFVPDGALKNVPLAALWNGEAYLIEQFRVATAPGIELLSSQTVEPGQRESLVAGVTRENQGFFPLPFVSRELDEIQRAIPGQALVNEQFTRKRLIEQLARAGTSIVHIATHGQFSSKASETFVLAWDERIGLSQLGEILNRRARQRMGPIDLLVLSACETAVGDDASALGMAGMAVRSGAQSTLASLWSVNDQSTSALMARFYQQLSQPQTGKAEALRQTQLAMLQDPIYRHPYYWSAFVLLGDWQ